ncbi:DUF998 domain-containing protein [Actinoplanes missouriensis]|uniref:DUF998 domain-containing protein n=1 Tax=Actinoplanes missouriensis TaxID=1866 RepID=UPI00340AE2D2
MTTALVPDSTVAPDSTVVPSRAAIASLAVAGPLWAAVSLAQVATRDGFDLMRHPLSLLSTGALGWIQIANFVLAGALLLAGAAALPGRWSPRLVRIAGAGMIAAGALVMDPGSGFPAGTPDTVPSTMSWHAIGHMAAGTVTFTALIAACYVLARHYSRPDARVGRRDGSRAESRAESRGGSRGGSRGLALGAALAGTALLAGDGWAMSGGPAGTVTLAVGAITAMCFLSVAALYPRP